MPPEALQLPLSAPPQSLCSLGTTLRTQAYVYGQQRVFSISSAWMGIRPEFVFRASPNGRGCGQLNYYRPGFILSHQEPPENIYNYYF